VKIVLVQGKYFNSWEALGLGYMGAYLKKHLKNAEIKYYQGCFDDEQTIVNDSIDADVIAFSCTTPTFNHVLGISRSVKQRNPRVVTVVGGYHPSASPQECLVDGIDHVVIGEGEAALLDIVKGKGERITRGRVMEFAELPWPDRDLIKNERNIEVAYKDNKLRIASFQSHRACPFRCKYCLDGHNKVLYGNVKKAPVRFRPVVDLLDEIGSVVKAYNLDLIKFSDPTWNTNVNWVIDFCRQKIERGIKIPFYPNIHATTCSKEMMEMMARAGCFKIGVGVESGSPKILKQIGKGTTVQSIKRCVEWAKECGIKVRGYFILGMPEEDDNDLKLTEKLADELDLEEYGFTLLCPYPGTQMYDPVRFNAIDWEKADEYSNDFWRTKYLSNQQLKECQRYLTEKYKERLTWHNTAIGHGS